MVSTLTISSITSKGKRSQRGFPWSNLTPTTFRPHSMQLPSLSIGIFCPGRGCLHMQSDIGCLHSGFPCASVLRIPLFFSARVADTAAHPNISCKPDVTNYASVIAPLAFYVFLVSTHSLFSPKDCAICSDVYHVSIRPEMIYSHFSVTNTQGNYLAWRVFQEVLVHIVRCYFLVFYCWWFVAHCASLSSRTVQRISGTSSVLSPAACPMSRMAALSLEHSRAISILRSSSSLFLSAPCRCSR